MVFILFEFFYYVFFEWLKIFDYLTYMKIQYDDHKVFGETYDT